MKSIVEYIIESNLTINEAAVDKDAVRELTLHAWNNEPCVRKMEAVIKAMNKKDPETISADYLAGSSVMKQITKLIIDTYNKEYADGSFKLNADTRKQLAKEIAEEMVNRMEDYK